MVFLFESILEANEAAVLVLRKDCIGIQMPEVNMVLWQLMRLV